MGIEIVSEKTLLAKGLIDKQVLGGSRPKDLIPAHSFDGKSDGKEIRLLQGPPFYRQPCRDL